MEQVRRSRTIEAPEEGRISGGTVSEPAPASSGHLALAPPPPSSSGQQIPSRPPAEAPVPPVNGRVAQSHIPDSDQKTRVVRVLLVDDDPETARGLSRSLTVQQKEVVVVTNGRDALAALQSRQFDVVIDNQDASGHAGSISSRRAGGPRRDWSPRCKVSSISGVESRAATGGRRAPGPGLGRRPATRPAGVRAVAPPGEGVRDP